jgi:hypothetical protein
MAVRLGDVLWWLGLLLGGGVWVALLALAHSAGPIDEAVFWASLIAALPIGFGFLCRYILSAKIASPADTVLGPAALAPARSATIESRSRPGIEPDARASAAAVVKLGSGFKSRRKSTSAVARAKKGNRFKVKGRRCAQKISG